MTEIERHIIKRIVGHLLEKEENVKFQIQFVDYESNDMWTLPVKLTEERAENFDDHSIVKVKFIFTDDLTATYELK